MISRKDAHLARKARAEQAFLERVAHHRKATAHMIHPFNFQRDREFNKIPSVIEVQPELPEKYAREREAEVMAVIAAERERVTMALGISLGSGS